MLERQFDSIADQRLARDKRVGGGAIGGAEGLDKAHPRLVAPHQHRRACHQGRINPFGPDDAVVATGRVGHHPLEILEPQLGIGQRMGQIKDRAVEFLPVDAAQRQLAAL